MKSAKCEKCNCERLGCVTQLGEKLNTQSKSTLATSHGTGQKVLLQQAGVVSSVTVWGHPWAQISHTQCISQIRFLLFFFLVFLQLYCPIWDYSHGKFELPSPGKASCDRVVLPNLWCMLGVSVFP